MESEKTIERLENLFKSDQNLIEITKTLENKYLKSIERTLNSGQNTEIGQDDLRVSIKDVNPKACVPSLFLKPLNFQRQESDKIVTQAFILKSDDEEVE